MMHKENTSGKDEAQRALAETRRDSARADTLIQETRVVLADVQRVREANHFTNKFRAIIQGGYHQ